MPGTSYLVDIELAVSGNPGASIGAADGKMSSLSDLAKGTRKELGRLGSSLADGFTGAVESVAGKLLTLGQMGLAGAVGAAAYGVAGINKGLEDTRTSIGAILEVSGAAGSIEQGISMGADAMARMRKDAAALPGTFDQLIDVFRAISTSGFNAGMAEPALEKMAERGMAAGAVMGLQSDMVGREMAQLLDGRAGAHNVFGARLGLTGAKAAEFNGMSSDKRVEVLTASLGKYDDAIKAFSTSYTALTTTFETDGKKFLGDATAPLFDRIKGTLGDANAWFDANQTKVHEWASDIGDGLVDAFDRGKEIALEYGPPFLRFIRTAKDEFLSIWKQAGPLVASIGESVKGFLDDPGAMKQLETLGKLYLAVKVGGAIGGGTGVGAIVGRSMQLGAAGYIAGAATGADGMGNVGMGAAAGASLGASAGGPAGAAMGAATGAAVGGLLSLGDAITGLVETDREYNQTLLEHNRAAQDVYGRIDTNSKGFADAVAEASRSVNWLSSIFESAADSMKVAAAKLNAKLDQANLEDLKRKGFGKLDESLAEAQRISDAKKAEFAKVDDAKKKKTVEGKGGMTINKVDITVSSNQSPEQVARMTLAELSHLRRFRTSSPRTLNFSAGR